MTLNEVAANLQHFNDWRRGHHDEQPDPRVIGEAIDAAVEMIERMEQQEPYSYIYEYANPIDGSPVWRNTPGYWNAQFPKSSKPLYALPGAKGEDK